MLKQKRIALFTHDTYGLGHVRRSLHIIEKLTKEIPELSVLLITGSPALEFFKHLPKGVDVMKIPTVVKTGAQGSKPPHLHLGLAETTRIRREIIKHTLEAFQPDLFLVDNFPLGSQDELLDSLVMLKQKACPCVLGVRDIIDAPQRVNKEWTRKGIHEILERYYSKILVYGLQEIFDSVEAYDLPKEKVHFTGMITSPINSLDKTQAAKHLGVKDKWILATGGGGGDAYPLFKALIEAVHDTPLVLVTGPLMGDKDRAQLLNKAKKHPHIHIKDYIPNLARYLKPSDLVIGMCGYNSAAEMVSSGANALVVPRTWRFGEHEKMKAAKQEEEQIFRARALQKAGHLSLLDHNMLNTKNLKETVQQLLLNPVRKEMPLTGLENATRILKEMIIA